MLLSTPLALLAYVLLLATSLASSFISWRLLRDNDRLHGKVDWLRQTLGTRDASIRSYESTGHDTAGASEWSDTVVIPDVSRPPPLPSLPPRPRRKP